MWRVQLVVLCVPLTVVALRAQMSPHAAEPVPEEILTRPVALQAGIGSMHQKVSTSSPMAQAFYDQGLAYLHSYVWVEAARSFHQSLRKDPNLGMAYVQLADTYIGLQDVVSARKACGVAHNMVSHMSAQERAWLEIREREIDYLENSSIEASSAYQRSIDKALHAYPQDPWLWIQRGLATEASPFTHGQASGNAALAFYEKALALDPKNLAAFHYIIHANENLGNIKSALQESAVYARLAPSIPHAHHMHGHELVRTGHTGEAIQEFLRTNELEENYYHAEKIPAKYDWHHAHNLQFLALSYELLGQDKTAAQLLHQAFLLPASTEFLAYNRKAWPEFLINHVRYQEALDAALEMSQGQWAMERLAGHSLAGQALLGLGRLEDAGRELDLANKEVENMPRHIAEMLPYPAVLSGQVLLHSGQLREGEEILVHVIQSALAMPGPDAWLTTIFMLESLARDARKVGDWGLARFVAEQMIEHDPYYAGGHFAIGLVAEHAAETDGARVMFTQAAKLWEHADPEKPELVLIHKKLSVHN